LSRVQRHHQHSIVIWVDRDKFDHRNMAVTCHFDVCRCEMCGALVTGSELSDDTYHGGARSHQLANASQFCKGIESL